MTKTSLLIFLSVLLTCHGFLDKLLDPLNVGGSIIKQISGVVHGATKQNNYGGYSNGVGYGGMSSVSYGYSGSSGAAGNGYGQNYGNREPSQEPEVTVIEITEPVQTNSYGILPSGNGYGSAFQEGYGSHQQQFGGGGHHGGLSHSGGYGLTFNINVGGLFGPGNSKHPHNHEHRPGHGYGYDHHHPGNGEFHGNQNPGQTFEYGNGNNQNPTEHGEFNRPGYGGYQNQDNYQNAAYPSESTYEVHQSEVNNYTPEYNNKYEGNNGYTTVTSSNDYFPPQNSNQNQNSGGYTNIQTQNPNQDEMNGTPDETDNQNQNASTGSSLDEIIKSVFTSTTEYSKTPYELEKDSKVTTTNRKTTIRPDTDQPLLIPLNPNEYKYEGDKIHSTAPKRNAEADPGANTNPVNSNVEKQDEDFDLDVRFSKDA